MTSRLRPTLFAAMTAALALCAITGPARAEPAAERIEIGQIATGYTYYNRPGATLADHNAELIDCAQISFHPLPGAQPGTMGSGLASKLIWSGPVAGLAAVRVENCMIVRGWRVVRLDPEEGRALAPLSDPELASRLTPWIGAVEPHGQIVRAFANQAAHPGRYHTASRPAAPGKGQFSLRISGQQSVGRIGVITPPSAPGQPPPPLRPQPGPPPAIDAQWPKRPVLLADIGKAPPGSALIVTRVVGAGNPYGMYVGFARVNPEGADKGVVRDGAPVLQYAAGGIGAPKEAGGWFVLVVPPGRWSLAGAGFIDYCLGAPSFELKAGEIVYAGTFSRLGPDFFPDLDLAPAKAFLAGAGGERVRAASYVNGLRSPCLGYGVTYAMEFPGAPFEPDYHWGGAGKP